MDAKKISELLEVTELSDEAVVPVVDGGKTKKAKVSLLKGVPSAMVINVINTIPVEDGDRYIIPYAQVPNHADVSIANYVKDYNGDIWLITGHTSGGLALKQLVKYIV